MQNRDKNQNQSGNLNTKSHYDILGIKQDASQREIDEAYKKLSTEWHPDKHK